MPLELHFGQSPHLLIHFPLLIVQLDQVLVHNFFGEFGQHFLLGAPQDERCGEVFQQHQMALVQRRDDEVVAKPRPRAEQSRIEELEQVPKLGEVVLQRRASQHDTAFGFQFHRCL